MKIRFCSLLLTMNLVENINLEFYELRTVTTSVVTKLASSTELRNDVKKVSRASEEGQIFKEYFS